MFEWKDFFDRAALEAGRYLSSRNNVSISRVSDGEITADVSADMFGGPYEVVVHFNEDMLYEYKCSCRLHNRGPCGHVAAVLFEYEALYGHTSDDNIISLYGSKRKPEKKKVPKEIFPFKDTYPENEYRYFRMDEMTSNIKIIEDTYISACKELETRTPSLDIHLSNYSESPCIYAYAHVITGGVPFTVKLTANKNRFTTVECSSYRCASTGYYSSYNSENKFTPCVHELVAMIALHRRLLEQNIGDSTNSSALTAISLLRHSNTADSFADTSSAGQTVHLAPRIKDNYRILLSFKIGTDSKMYVLKDIRKLVNAVHNKEEFPLGKNLSLNFARDTFSDVSLKYFELLERYLKDESAILHTYMDYCPEGARPDIPLSGSLLDNFYDLSVRDDAPVLTSAVSGSVIKLSESMPDINLTIDPNMDSNGIFHGITLSGELPELLDGAKYLYSFDGLLLSRISTDYRQILNVLYSSSRYNKLKLTVGRQHLTEFYQDILPEIRKTAAVKDNNNTEFLSSYIPPKPVFEFYLDAEDGIPVCTVCVLYGETKHTLSPSEEPLHSSDMTRNISREQHVVSEAASFYPYTASDGAAYKCADDDSAIYEALTTGTKVLCSLGEVFTTNAFDSLSVRKKPNIQVGVSVQGDLMNLSISSDITMEELRQVLESYRLKKKYHRLKTGGYVEIDDSVADLNELVETLRLKPDSLDNENIEIPAYRALYLDKMLEKSEDIYANRDRHFKQLIKSFKTIDDSDFEVPADLEKTMRNYQVHGYKWLRTLSSNGFGGILADDMGLGKTLQVISVLTAEKQEGTPGTSLIICPASLVFNWGEEFRKFSPGLKVCQIAGTQEERLAMIENIYDYDAAVTSYDLLRRDIKYYEDRKFLYEIIDEAQYIKNHSTQASKSVKIIKADHKLALTGTPVENRLSELWSIFDYLMPGFLYSYEVFRKSLETPITKNRNKNVSERLRKMVSPFILRRLKSDVLKDLPEKTEEVRFVKLDTEQRKLYDAQVAKMKQMIGMNDDAELSRKKIQILAELTKIRQLCCDPSLLFSNYTGGSAKKEACTDLIESAVSGDHKVLVFSQFTSMLELLKDELDSKNISYYEITGSTPKQERLNLVNRFNEDNTPVFLISLKAGGTGLNLTGADIVIHYDPWWNAAAQNQATDRAHRIGQTKPVTVYKIIVKDSIEEKIQEMQQLKLDIADEIISGEASSIGSLSKEELLSILV